MEDCDFCNMNTAVVGLGLIGGSYAMALKSLNVKHITGIDRNPKTLKKALDMNIINAAYERPGEFLKNMDFIIVALYPKDTIDFIKQNLEYFKSGVIITDTSGIKKMVLDSVEKFLPDDVEFVAGHPMAGREYKGIDYADKDIFKGANYIITPGSRNSKSSIEFIASVAEKIGCKNVEYISADDHDRIIAYTSQLPHVIAAALMNEKPEKFTPELFVGGSFRDATRVALLNSKLWSELFTLNSDKLVDTIDAFQKILDRIKKDVEDQNKVDLEEIFENSTALRKKFR